MRLPPSGSSSRSTADPVSYTHLKEESIDKKADAIERREAGLTAKEEELKRKSKEVERLSEERVQELERISGLTSEQAKDYLLKTVEDEVKQDTAKL